MQNLKEKWLVLSKMTWGIWKILTGTEKKDLTLEGKMVELNQIENSKQQDQSDAVWKLYFTWEISNK